MAKYLIVDAVHSEIYVKEIEASSDGVARTEALDYLTGEGLLCGGPEPAGGKFRLLKVEEVQNFDVSVSDTHVLSIIREAFGGVSLTPENL